MEGGVIVSIRPHTGIPEPFVVSPAFVNAHSHMEYRGLAGAIPGQSYAKWIHALTQIKQEQSEDDLARDCLLACQENLATGVGFVAEHSDRPFSYAAMATAGLPGRVYQELLTFYEPSSSTEIWARAQEAHLANGDNVGWAPHAPHTVSWSDLRAFSNNLLGPISIHVAETTAEREFWTSHAGPIAERYRLSDIPFPPRFDSAADALFDLSLTGPWAQWVHACDLSKEEIQRLAATGTVIAHCPRSNSFLGCPPAPVREMLDAGIIVGLGLDSCASSGTIDMFAEMRSALETSQQRSQPLKPEEIWLMATEMGARSLGVMEWKIAVGNKVPLIALELPGAHHTLDLIEHGSPTIVRWL